MAFLCPGTVGIFELKEDRVCSANIHLQVKRFLEVDESLQYVPNESRMREAFLAAESDSMAEKTKRMIQTSSSLLEVLPCTCLCCFRESANNAMSR